MFIRMEINTQGLSITRKVKDITIYNNWIFASANSWFNNVICIYYANWYWFLW